MKYLYNKQRIRRSKRKMSNLKRVLLSLMIFGVTVSWAKEFKIMTYNIYGARLTNGQKLGESIKPYAPDFVSLQEVDKFTKRSNFRDVTSDMIIIFSKNREIMMEENLEFHLFQNIRLKKYILMNCLQKVQKDDSLLSLNFLKRLLGKRF